MSTPLTREQLIEQITREVLNALDKAGISADMQVPSSVGDSPAFKTAPVFAAVEQTVRSLSADRLLDLTEPEYKETIQLDAPENPLALRAMENATTARVGIGRAGERLSMKAMLSLRADHAMAKDAVVKPVDEDLLKALNLPVVQSCCTEINEHLTRPDLGRQLSEEARQFLRQSCVQNPQIQVYVSDGLSNSAVENNIKDLLPILMDGLEASGLKVGTPFFVKYGRVPTMDDVSETLGAELTVVLLGERPGLAASDSLSAYITYGAYVGIPESKRTVVSNIHRHGIQPVEAGAYLAELLERILREKKSGVDLQL